MSSTSLPANTLPVSTKVVAVDDKQKTIVMFFPHPVRLMLSNHTELQFPVGPNQVPWENLLPAEQEILTRHGVTNMAQASKRAIAAAELTASASIDSSTAKTNAIAAKVMAGVPVDVPAGSMTVEQARRIVAADDAAKAEAQRVADEEAKEGPKAAAKAKTESEKEKK